MIDSNFFKCRILGCRIEERETDKSWFSKHLGNICSRLVEDLEVIKKLCEPCFPPSYKVFDYCVDNIHSLLESYLRELIDGDQLHGQEFFVLMSWTDVYKSTYFMGHPNLQYDTSKLGDLLNEQYYEKVLSQHIEYTSKKMSSWFQNAVEKNYNEWLENVPPNLIDGNLESSMPNDINSMLIQQVNNNYNCFILRIL